MRPAVFLDRDGTIVEDVGYLDRTERIALYPWTADALRLLARAGFALIVVTNQSGVARGLFPESRVHDVHTALDRRLARGSARLDAYLLLPALPGWHRRRLSSRVRVPQAPPRHDPAGRARARSRSLPLVRRGRQMDRRGSRRAGRVRVACWSGPAAARARRNARRQPACAPTPSSRIWPLPQAGYCCSDDSSGLPRREGAVKRHLPFVIRHSSFVIGWVAGRW